MATGIIQKPKDFTMGMDVVWNNNISKYNAGTSRFSGQAFVFNWNFLMGSSINAGSVIATVTNLPSNFAWVYGVVLDGNGLVGRCHTTSNTVIVDVALDASKNYTLIVSGLLV